MPLNPTKLKPIEIVRIVNTTPLNAVLNDRQLRRHRDRAGFRISDDGGQTVNLFKYAAWLRSELMLRQSMTPLTYEEKKNAARNRNLALAMAGRDIGELPEVVNPERKKRCRTNFRMFCEEYFPETFSLEWSPDHLKAIHKIETAVLKGGLFALAMPRGSGKSSLTEVAAIWSMLYGHREFIVLIGATESAALELLDSLMTELEVNEHLAADFPEVCFPIQQLDGIANRCAGQLYHGERTRITWTSNEIVLPTIKGSKASGIVVRVAGITGRIRGMKYKRPDGRSVRPSLVVIDDPQTSESAGSLEQTRKRIRVLAGDILGLAGPGQKISGIMPCTIIRPGDMADIILNRQTHPDWNGERTKMVYEFPKNMKLWEKYAEIRAEALREEGNFRRATEFYEAHRAEMDEGAKVSWEARYNHDEISALQHAMNLKFQDEIAFAAEYQNDPLPEDTGGEEILSVDAICAKINGLPHNKVPLACDRLTLFIDVQKALLFYVVTAWAENFTGSVIDYGSWPDQHRREFSLADANPTIQSEFPRAGLEGGLYAALTALTDDLLGREWEREDGAVLKIERALIDANWGQSTDLVYEFCRESRFAGIVLPSHGRYVGASSKPMTEYRKQPGDRLGFNRMMPSVAKKRAVRHVIFDSNFWKSFVHARLAVPIGDKGSLTLYGRIPGVHQLLAEHLTAEYRVKTSGRGRTVDETRQSHNYLEACDEAGNLIRKGSDILTSSAERYVITGNPVFRDRYFLEAKRDKKREAGLEKVKGFPNAEILRRDLNEAMRYSMELMSLEYHAMRLVITDAELASPDCPPEVRDYVLTAEEKAASPEARREMASNIVFGLNYLTYKDHIYSSIERSLRDADVFLNQYRTGLTERYKVLYFYQLCTYAGFFLALLAFVTFLIRQRGRANSFLRIVLDNIPMLFSIKDARSERYVDCNMAFARYACRNTVAEVIGNTDAQIFDEATASQFVEDDRKTLSGDVTTSFFENALDAHGKPYSFLTTKLKIRDMDGNTCLFGLSQDVTEAMEKQRSSEAIAEALLALQTYDAVSHPQKVIEVIRKRLNADFCHLIRFDEASDEAVVEPDCHAHLDPTTPCELVVASLNDFRYYTRHSEPLEPFEIEERAPLEILRMYAVLDAHTDEWHPTTTYSMPVNRQGTLFGTLAIGYAMKRTLSQFEKEFIETSVKILENALERQKTYSDLSAANARINREYDFVNNIFDIMPIPCVIKDVGNDFRCMRCNEAYSRLFQKQHDEIVDLNSADLFSPEIAQRLRDADQKAVRENKMIFEELVCMFPDGEHTFLYRRGPMTLPDGRLVLFCVAEEITELRRQTDKVLQINEKLQGEYQRAVNAEEAETFFAKSLKSILAMPPDQDAIIPSIEEVGKYIGADRCFIYYRTRDDEENSSWELTYEWCGEGIEKKFKAKTDVSMFPDVCEALEHGEDFLATDIRSIHPVTCAWLQAQSVQSIIITPLRDEHGSVFGFIGFDFIFHAQEQFSERIIRSVHEAADVILICRERNKRQATMFKALAEEKLRSEIFESAAIPLLLFKPDGTIVTANSAALKAFGGTLSEVVGCKCHDFVCQYETRPEECPLRHPERGSQEFLLHRRDGQYFAIKTQTIRNDKGDPMYILECAVDMTETHELHENAEAIAQSLLALQSKNVISSPIQVLNIIRRRLGANTVYLAQYDRKAGVAFLNPEYTLLDNGETLAGRAEAGLDDLAPFLDRLKDEGICDFEGSSRRRIRDAYAKRSHGIVIPPSETILMVPLEVRGESWGNLSITYAKHRHLGERDKEFFIRCREVLEAALERKLYDDDLHAALDKEIAAEKAKSFFFSSVSHDIRTPLNAIIGYSELLIGGIADEQERSLALSAISTSGQTLLQLINDVLDLSKLESGKMVINPVLTDVRELASSVLHTFDVSVMNKPVVLKEEYGSLPLLEVDPQRIRQILFNLIGNAVKYTKRGEICVRASFRNDIGDENGVLIISVSDTGCGIADEDKEKLVNPFVQAGVDAKIKGTGLGLTICKQLAARMGGHFSFVSELGKGSTFALELRDVKSVERTSESQKEIASGQELIRLEMKREAADRKAPGRQTKPDAGPGPEKENKGKDAAPGSASVPGNGLKKHVHVLIADDVKLNLSVLKALLAKIGVRDVVMAVNGVDAWDKVQAAGKPFDIVLTDIWMPEMDGKEFVARIRADKRFADLPVYAITADIEAQKDFVEHGFTGLLLKPVTIDKISPIFLNE